MDLSGAYTNLIAPLAFSAANFDSGDAGSGAYANVQQGIEELIQYHMNQSMGITEDERDFLRPWRRRLRDIIVKENDNLVEFLKKPADEWPATTRHADFLKALTTSGIASSSAWMSRHIADIVNPEIIMAEINSELTVPLNDARTSVHQAMNIYLQTLPRLFELNGSIDKKLTQLEDLRKKMATLDTLSVEGGSETDADSQELQQAVLKYLQSRYASLNIKEDYTAFMKEYARFSALRSLLMSTQGAIDHHGNPICSICTVDRVTSALSPCGHVFCNNCSQKQRALCYVCRTPIRDRLRIYFM